MEVPSYNALSLFESGLHVTQHSRGTEVCPQHCESVNQNAKQDWRYSLATEPLVGPRMGVGGGEVGEDTLLSIEVHMTQECDLEKWNSDTHPSWGNFLAQFVVVVQRSMKCTSAQWNNSPKKTEMLIHV